ncbi:PP2C family protein-serine/threonine phosphatase [Diaphorobacter aerolatus]|uniref:Serine/threonine-protein phosphatase n=1 Tax=Diaphorobacter aerolatus TaxID=1288495 RepID=A0A7H0GLI9_9BURK|nr:protein phosphatase 2C domain-containing protein [Diaphorobacter aerolatus]QNP49155.1 serine/threonine-protein phosphatase [Diaphorobacter aerolatus]
MEFEIATLSSQGGRDYNEDVHGHWHDGNMLACLVADGAGGHGGGDVAAQTVKSSVLGGFSMHPALDASGMRALLEQANADIVSLQAQGGSLAHMRSTAVLAVIDLHTESMMWAHSGDSRAYLFRDHAIVARTTDHSLVQQMVSGGMLDEEGARRHPQRNVLLSALGSNEEPPDIAVSSGMQLRAGDVLLLCSDGVWEVLGDAGLLDALRGCASAAQWVAQLNTRISSLSKPGSDNFTALVIWVGMQAEDRTVLL